MSPPDLAGRRLLPWSRVFALIVASDVVLVLAGLWIAHVVRFTTAIDLPFEHGAVMPVWFIFPIAVGWLVIFRVHGLYTRGNLVSGIGEYGRVGTAGLLATLLIVVLAYARVQPYIARGFLLVAAISVTALVCLGRFAVRRYVYGQAAAGRPLDRILIIGTSRHAIAVARQIAENPSAASEVVGFLSEYMPRGVSVMAGQKVLGEPLQLEALAARHHATMALIVESGLSWESLQGLIRMMHKPGALRMSLIPGLFDLHSTQMRAEQIGPVLTLAPQPVRIVGVDAAIKRTMDLVLGCLAVLASIPILVVVIAAGAIRGDGPSFSREIFRRPSGEFTTWRLTRPSWAARAHLARLPGLFQVLTGRMSILGPRPVTAEQADEYEGALELIESAKPGFIGPWWLVGIGRPTAISEELNFDLYYLRNYSVWLDLQILLQVVRALTGTRRAARASGGWSERIRGAAAASDDIRV